MAHETRRWQLTVRDGDRASAVAVLLLGVYLVHEALQLKFGSVTRPGPGFYPTVLAVLLVGVSGALLLQGLRRTDGALAVGFGPRTGYIVLTAGAITLYATVLEAAGFLACTFALVFALLTGIGKVGWWRALLVAAVGTISVYVVFRQLGIPLPKGMLGI